MKLVLKTASGATLLACLMFRNLPTKGTAVVRMASIWQDEKNTPKSSEDLRTLSSAVAPPIGGFDPFGSFQMYTIPRYHPNLRPLRDHKFPESTRATAIRYMTLDPVETLHYHSLHSCS